MLKYVLLATSVAIASPAFAQDATPSQPTQTAPAQTMPDANAPAEKPPTGDVSAAAQTAPAQDATTTAQTAPMPAEPATAPTEQAQAMPDAATPAQQPTESASTTPATQPAATQDQVAQAVGREFGSYDKNGDGSLDKTEFAAWMGALRKASEPSFNAGSPEAATWTAQAFTAADADKSASVNQSELTTFLTPKS